MSLKVERIERIYKSRDSKEKAPDHRNPNDEKKRFQERIDGEISQEQQAKNARSFAQTLQEKSAYYKPSDIHEK